MIEILVKYLILEGCTPELRTHFLERRVRSLDVEEFQELGVAFQAAHGRAKHVDFSADRKKFGFASHEDDSSTMLAWKVEVKREAAEIEKITKMSLKEGRSYASEERFCFNCLRKDTLAGNVGIGNVVTLVERSIIPLYIWMLKASRRPECT